MTEDLSGKELAAGIRAEVAAAAAEDIDGWGGAPDPADPDGTSLLLPPRLAIARRLIEHWLEAG